MVLDKDCKDEPDGFQTGGTLRLDDQNDPCTLSLFNFFTCRPAEYLIQEVNNQILVRQHLCYQWEFLSRRQSPEKGSEMSLLEDGVKSLEN